MKAVLQRIEYNWWNFHIRVLDESQWIREILPKVQGIWERREEAMPYLVLSILGFPLGVLLGILSVYVK
ncbi:MAG: hypothetical protein J7L35_03255 [Anaerolineales bacterium]|nr:hypothetical protein [Anaerolineales bacterium]